MENLKFFARHGCTARFFAGPNRQFCRHFRRQNCRISLAKPPGQAKFV